MAASITIDVVNDAGLMAAQRLALLDRPGTFEPVIKRAAANTVKAHFAQLQADRPNKQGWPRRNYWAGCARSVTQSHRPGLVTISITQLGFRLRLEGGIVTPGKGISTKSGKPTQFLTIPARPEAYKATAKQYGNLQFAYVDGRPALVAKEGGATRERVVKGLTRSSVIKGAIQGTVMYWLARKTTHQPDPSVLPTKEKMMGEISSAIGDAVDALVDRGQAGGAA